jgi:dihydroflavonol-4-reductase
MKTYFITGANGLVGSYLTKEILDKGYGKVIGLKRANSQLDPLGDYARQVQWITGGLLDMDSLAEGIAQADYVIHAAAAVSFDDRQRNLIRQINIDGTANVVNTCLDYPHVELLHISSVAAIGKEKGEHILNENSQWEENIDLPEYATSKYLAELEVWRAIAEGLNAVIVNPSAVLGVGDWSRSSLQIFDYVAGEHTFYPPGKLNYVDARDLAEISLALLHQNIRGERFILNGGSISYKEMFEQIAEKISVQPPGRRLSPLLGKWVAGADALRAFFTQSERKITRDLVKSTSQEIHFSNQKISDTLGMEFRSLTDTLNWATNTHSYTNS